MRLTWLGHSSIKLETAQSSVYIDPYAGEDEQYKPASLILVSRFDYDHCNMQKIRKMIVDKTKIIGTKKVARELYPCDVIKVGEKKSINDLEVIGMPVLHPRTGEREDAIGFLIIAEDKRIYYMADSAYEPEMDKSKPTVLLVSVGGTVTHGERKAAEVTDFLKPELAIPIHWGSREGTRDDAELFKEFTQSPVKILEPGESIEI